MHKELAMTEQEIEDRQAREQVRLQQDFREMLEALEKIVKINIDLRYTARMRQSLTVQAAEAAIHKARGVRMTTTTHTPGAMRAAIEINKWFNLEPRHDWPTDSDLAKNIDRETGAAEMEAALAAAPEMNSWALMTSEEREETIGGYIIWYHNQRKTAIAKARGVK